MACQTGEYSYSLENSAELKVSATYSQRLLKKRLIICSLCVYVCPCIYTCVCLCVRAFLSRGLMRPHFLKICKSLMVARGGSQLLASGV